MERSRMAPMNEYFSIAQQSDKSFSCGSGRFGNGVYEMVNQCISSCTMQTCDVVGGMMHVWCIPSSSLNYQYSEAV